jgi:hypothetical protein
MNYLLLASFLLITAPATVPNAQAPGALNPAVTQDSIQETICMKGWSASVRPNVAFTERIKRQLLRQQYPMASLREFELDHRVPIEDGGCPDCETNLWLQPRRDPHQHKCIPDEMLDAACKDVLERLVHRRICSGEMSLRDGQQVFLGDWQQAYHQLVEDVQ